MRYSIFGPSAADRAADAVRTAQATVDRAAQGIAPTSSEIANARTVLAAHDHYAYVHGVLVDISSPEYAAWYAAYYADVY